jgi:hypothetical protein
MNMDKKKVLEASKNFSSGAVILAIAGVTFLGYGAYKLGKTGVKKGIQTYKRYNAGKKIEEGVKTDK